MDQGWTTVVPFQSTSGPRLLRSTLGPPSVHFSDIPREIERRLVHVQLQPPAWQLFLLSVYEHYPPPGLPAEEIADELRHISSFAMSSTPGLAFVTRSLRKALLLYHPDKNPPAVRGERWAEDAGRITRMATSLLGFKTHTQTTTVAGYKFQPTSTTPDAVHEPER